MNKIVFTLLLLICVCAVAYSQQLKNGDAPTTPVPIPNLQLRTNAVRWQYKLVDGNPSEQDLNVLGDESWELAGATQKDFSVLYVFKRVKQ